MPDGSMECILGQMQAELTAMRAQVEDMSDRVRIIEDTLLSARVSWKAGVAVVMALGVLGNIVLTYLHDPLQRLAKSVFSP